MAVVVGLPPTSDDRHRFGHGNELFAGKASVSETAVEALYEAILPKAARRRILQEHSRFDRDHAPPESIGGDPAAVAEWRVGIAGEWPGIIRPVDELPRSSWHYQLGANLVFGVADAPDAPGWQGIQTILISLWLGDYSGSQGQEDRSRLLRTTRK